MVQKARIQTATPKSREEIEALIPLLPKDFGIVSIDQSYSCTGLCFVDRLGMVYDTIIPRKTLGVGRLLEIESRLVGFLKLHRASVVVMEGYSRNSQHRREEAGECSGVVKLLLYRMQIPTYVISPLSAKLFMTGKGNAKKEEMVAACSLTPRLIKEGRSRQVQEAIADSYALALSCLSILTDPESAVKFTKVVTSEL